MSKGVQIAVAATAIALLLGWYGYAQLEGEGSFTYYESLAEFQAAPATPGRSAAGLGLSPVDSAARRG